MIRRVATIEGFGGRYATDLDDSLGRRGLKPTATIKCRSAAEAQDNRPGQSRTRRDREARRGCNRHLAEEEPDYSA